jgi:hypothetical protein
MTRYRRNRELGGRASRACTRSLVGCAHLHLGNLQRRRKTHCDCVCQLSLTTLNAHYEVRSNPCLLRKLRLSHQPKVTPIAEVSLAWIGANDIGGVDAQSYQCPLQKVDLRRGGTVFPPSDRLCRLEARKSREVTATYLRTVYASGREQVWPETPDHTSTHLATPGSYLLIMRHLDGTTPISVRKW